MLRIASIFLTCLAAPAFATLGTHTSRQLQSTIVDLAVATPDLSTLVQAATAAGLVEILSDAEETLTLFAPTNDAFGALPEGLLATLLTPGFNRHLTEILLFHVFAAEVLSIDLEPTQELEMFNGELVTVDVSDLDVVTVTTAGGTTVTVTTADVVGSNGIVHIIDGVLVPSSIGATVIAIGAQYSTLLSLITLAGLEATLTSAGPFTLFAPNNAAFAELPTETVAFLQSADGTAVLTDILTYHVVAGSVTADLVMDGAMVATEQGAVVTFAVGTTVMVNDATVVDPDMLAINGVTHGIDTVLIPPTIADLAVATPDLSTLVQAATAAGLVEILSDAEETLTLFAPTNDAFGALPEGLLTTLLTPGFNQHLTEILLFHAIEAAFLSSNLEATQEVEMSSGEMVTINKSDLDLVTVVTAGGTTATVTTADVVGSNGVVHIIDSVLVPSSIGATVIDIDAAQYSTLLSLVTLAGLEATLRSAGPFTLFAPNNAAFTAAFAELSTETVAFLQSADGNATLTGILEYHVVAESVTADLVMDGAMVATVQGDMVTFAVGTTVMVNDATVVDPDILAFNGVTHGIDTVLLPSTIADLAVATPDLSTLVQAATAAGLVGFLSDFEETLTLFAPTNDAFGALPAGLLTTLLTPEFKQHLNEILRFHAIEAAVLSSVLEATQEVEMSTGEMVTINKSDVGVVTVVTAGGVTATVTTADVEGSNGVVHIIDSVLVPSTIGATVIAIDAEYSTLLSLITLAGLDATLTSMGPFTLFAPKNAAFAKLPTETVEFLQSEEGKPMLTEILKYHVVAGSVTSDLLMDDAKVGTVQGEMVTFSVVGSTVMVNDATVVKADILAFNGVTHGIDTVLMPPSTVEAVTMAPTMAPTSGGMALGASLSALLAGVLTVAL